MQISGRPLPVLIVLLLCSCETTNYASNNVGADNSYSLVEFLPPPQQMMIVQKTVTPDQVANLAAQVLDSSDLDV